MWLCLWLCVCALSSVFFCTSCAVNIKQEVIVFFSRRVWYICLCARACTRMSRRRERRSGPYRRQIYRDMCDSHLHTHTHTWGARGSTCMLILASDSIPAHCYYTQLRQLCVFLSLYLSAPLTVFTPFCLTAESPPRPTTSSPPPSRPSFLLPINPQFRSLFLAQMWRLLMTALRRLQPCYLCLVWQVLHVRLTLQVTSPCCNHLRKHLYRGFGVT